MRIARCLHFWLNLCSQKWWIPLCLVLSRRGVKRKPTSLDYSGRRGSEVANFRPGRCHKAQHVYPQERRIEPFFFLQKDVFQAGRHVYQVLVALSGWITNWLDLGKDKPPRVLLLCGGIVKLGQFAWTEQLAAPYQLVVQISRPKHSQRLTCAPNHCMFRGHLVLNIVTIRIMMNQGPTLCSCW